MKILITGATGLVGKAIVKQCESQDISVHYLTTSKAKIKTEKNYKGFYWNPTIGEIDLNCFKDVDGIISLAGASIAKRWTKAYKKELIDSRVKGLELLKTTIEKHNIEIQQLVSASAIGIYPHSLSQHYYETEQNVSNSFLGNVVKEWEKAADLFTTLQVKVTKVRVGLVLDNNEGAFPKIVNPTRYGLGAAFGNGTQWQSWIHIKDVATLFLHCISQRLDGVYNAVSPSPITNNELTSSVAKHLKKSLLLPNVPKVIMRMLLGEMHILLFESQKVSSKKIEATNFKFEYDTIDKAINDLLK